ncbi:MAG: 2-amino-4-ketopentanoate thiolase [Acholeplasmatales bacterium]|nr:MAG: 2-amino-4-ketopentanoate thiolase [Acholeplasmatales bacterium]
MLEKKGTYVRIRRHLLLPKERSGGLPKDTQEVPLKMWIRGRLCEEAELFEEVSIQTASGRVVSGVLKEVEPKYKHTYGDFVDEVLQMRETILSEMWGDDDDV